MSRYGSVQAYLDAIGAQINCEREGKVHVDEPEREKEKERGEDGGEGKEEVGERKGLEGEGWNIGGKEKRGIGRRGEREGRIMKKVSTKLASL